VVVKYRRWRIDACAGSVKGALVISGTRFAAGFVTAVLCIAGCASNTQFLDKSQNQAVETALARGKFELNCPEAKPTVLSREFVEPGPPMGLFYRGPQPVARSEYTIGLEGCGKRMTFVVVCPVSDTIIPESTGEGCLATGPGRFLAD
jgi:hypothetical protein